MFHLYPWHFAWLATCCLLVCSIDAQIQVPCPAGHIRPDGGACVLICAEGATTLVGTKNLARACGASGTAACATGAKNTKTWQVVQHINDGVIGNLYHSNCGTNDWLRIDFGVARDISRVKITYTDRRFLYRWPGAKVRVGDINGFDSNPVCATLVSAVVNDLECVATGRYMFLVTGMRGGDACIVLQEMEAYGTCTACPTGQSSVAGSNGFLQCQCSAGYGYTADNGGTCALCHAGTFKDAIGSAACSPCPSGTYEDGVGSVSCKPCQNNQVGGDAEMLFMQVQSGIQFSITREGNGLLFAFYHHSWKTRHVVYGHDVGGFQRERWYHLAWVMESSRKRWSIYIDGERVDLPLVNPWQPYRDKPYNNIRLRGAGQIDDFRIYHRGLTAREVQTAHKQSDPYGVCGLTESNGITCPRLCRVHAGSELTPSGANTQPCPANSYQNGWGVHCVPCPLGSSTNATGNGNVAACECHPGYARQASGQGKCELCESGKFKAEAGPAACTTCAANEFSDPGSLQCGCNAGYTGIPLTSCQACAAGTYKNSTGSAECSSCETNRSTPVGSKKKSDCMCIDGFMGFDTGVCASSYECPLHADKPDDTLRTSCRCNAGYSGLDMHGPCEICRIGTFKENKGSELCQFCLPDSNTVTTGSVLREACECDAGFTGDNGGFCTKCEIGKYKTHRGSAPCTSCPTGGVSALGSTELVQCICDLGYTGQPGLTCTACETGTYKDFAGDGRCTACSRFSDAQSGSTSRLDCFCDQGYRRNVDDDLPNTHVDIAEQQTGVGGWRLVRFMPQRTGAGTWYRMCDLLHGFITVGVAYDNTTDWTIPFGEFDQLLLGTYDLGAWMYLPKSSSQGGHSAWGNNVQHVYATSYKRYGHSASIRLTDLDRGGGRPYFGFTEGGHDIGPDRIYMEGLSASAGRTLSSTDGLAVWARHSNPAWCRVCPANTYNAVIGASVCSDCPANSRAPPTSTTIRACLCLPGYFGPAGGPCVACPEGTFQPEENAPTCLLCEANTVSLPASLLCQCGAGWTGPDNGPCEACPVGTSKGVAGPGFCQTCAANTESLSTGSGRCQCHTGMLGIGNVFAHETTPVFKEPLVMDVNLIRENQYSWRYRTDFQYALPLGYNKVSVMARSYRNSVSIALSGIALQIFTIGDEQKCGTATIVSVPYNQGDSLSIIENWHVTPSELYLILELTAADFVDCKSCPVGYIISDDGVCVACPVDTYNPESAGQNCTTCPVDTRAAAASSDKKDCKCRGAASGDAGLTGPDGGPCQACAEQHYKAEAGAALCDRITNANESMSFPHASGTPVRSILDRGFRGSWLPGDQVRVQRRGRRRTDDVVLTYTNSTTSTGTDYYHWTPANVHPLLWLQDTYRFYVQPAILLQINASESGFALQTT